MRQIDRLVEQFLNDYKRDLSNTNQEWPQNVQNVVKCIHKHLFDQELTVE
jgi:hypothetical protein